MPCGIDDEVATCNFHLTGDWKNKDTIEPGSHYLQRGGMIRMGLLPVVSEGMHLSGVLYLGFLSSHKFLNVTLGDCYFGS